MIDPIVDVIIPVHTDERPIARAVASVLHSTTADVRVNVVCHNVEVGRIARALGLWAGDPRVRLLEHRDEAPSPAGPVNAGYRSATAEFTALLDSDDVYETGAIDAWLAVQRRDDADVVIQPLRHADGRSPRTPPLRPGRRKRLNGVKDRLAYRTRQHGLVRRSSFPGLAMTPGLRTGEDVVQGARIWYSPARISYARGAPAYVIHTDRGDRTSARAKPAAESLAFLDDVLGEGFLSRLSAEQRESFAVKLLRTHIMDVLSASIAMHATERDMPALSQAVQRITDVAPTAMAILSRREARIVRALLGGRYLDWLAHELLVVTDYRRPSNLIPASLPRLFHREAPLRLLIGFAFMR